MRADEIYRVLLDNLGPQGWWPGDSPLEVMVGAVLVQNTAWANVERAIENLKDAGALDAQRLAAMSAEEQRLYSQMWPHGGVLFVGVQHRPSHGRFSSESGW